MTPPPDSIDRAYSIMKASFITALTSNAADALIAGEVRASKLLRIPLNFNLINSRAVSATLAYREDMERFGGSMVTKIVDGVPKREFSPWLNDMVARDKERVGQIIQDAMKSGQVPEQALADVFTMGEHSARLVARTETKALYNKGTFERYNHEHVQQATWMHMDPQPDPREEHQALDGQVFDLDDPIWAELDEPNCHCYAEPVLNFGSIGNVAVNNAGDENWITINGQHILIKDGETPGQAFERQTGAKLGGSKGSDNGSKATGTAKSKVASANNQRLTESLERKERSLIHEEFENAAVFDDMGYPILYATSQEKDKVSFTPQMAKQMKDKYLTHNHPTDGSFSDMDYKLVSGVDAKEIRAAGKTQTYSLSRPDDGWPDWESQIKPSYERADKEVTGDLWSKVLSQEISPEVAQKVTSHLIWQKVSNEHGLDYRRKES